MTKIRIHKPDNKHQYTDEFKLYVVKYIQKHPNMTAQEIADKFKIKVHNVKRWPLENKAKIGKAIIMEWKKLLNERENMLVECGILTGVHSVDMTKGKSQKKEKADGKMLFLVTQSELYKCMIQLIEARAKVFFNALWSLSGAHRCYLSSFLEDCCTIDRMASVYHISVSQAKRKLQESYVALYDTFDIDEIRAPTIEEIKTEALDLLNK